MHQTLSTSSTSIHSDHRHHFEPLGQLIPDNEPVFHSAISRIVGLPIALPAPNSIATLGSGEASGNGAGTGAGTDVAPDASVSNGGGNTTNGEEGNKL